MMDDDTAYDQTFRLHGFRCPEAALGVRFADTARNALHSADNDPPLFVRAATIGCLLDGLQVYTGATLGNGRLVADNHGKLTAEFWQSSGQHAIRVCACKAGPGYVALAVTQIVHHLHCGDAVVAGENTRLNAATDAIMRTDSAELFTITSVELPTFDRVELFDFEECMKCGEPVRGNRLFNHGGVKMCDACHLYSHGGVLPAVHPKDPILS